MFRLSKITDYGIVILAHLAAGEDVPGGATAGGTRSAGLASQDGPLLGSDSPSASTPDSPSEDPREFHNAREVANAIDLPQPVVSKIMKLLARHGVLESHRGSKGGFILTRDPASITVEEMIAALQGPVALTECSSDAPGCQIEGHCRVRDPWQVITRVVQVALSKITLADLIDPSFTSAGTTLQILSRQPGGSLTNETPGEVGEPGPGPERAEH